MIEATCHCGMVTIQIQSAPETVTDCNCSICRRYGVLWAYYHPAQVQMFAKEGATINYQWGDKSLEFHHCRHCGCVTHWAAVKQPANRMGVNARLMPPDVLAAARRRRLDGAGSTAPTHGSISMNESVGLARWPGAPIGRRRKTRMVRALLTLLIACLAADFAPAASAVIVPVRMLQHFPVLTASIDGVPVLLQLDSGNSGTVSLTQAVLDAVKAVPTGEFSQGFDGKGNVMKYPRYRIPLIKIGTIEFTDVIGELDVHDPSYQATQVGQQGYLGTGLLKRYRVVLDYARRRIVLEPSENKDSSACHGTAVPFVQEARGEPGTKAEVDLGSLTVAWDTGAPTSMISKSFAVANGAQKSAVSLKSEHLTLSSTDFGPLTFHIEELSLPPWFAGFIGYNFFAHHVVCLDFPLNRVLIQR